MAEQQPKPAPDASAEVVVRASRLSKTFVVGFIPIKRLARSAAEAVRPELDQRVLPREVKAVRELSFEVRAGEIFGLLGPNGSGKTTTIKMMMGLIFPTSGEIEVLGRSVPDVAAKARVGYLPENPSFYDYLRADEFLELSARLCGVPRKERLERIPRLLARVGLTQALNRSLRKFSKGMLQRIGLAQALIHDPDLVVLDEPLSGLDPLGRKEVRDLILELRAQGKTVLFSSHILSDVEMICDRVAIVIEGQLRDIGRLDQLLSARVEETEVVLERAPASVLELAEENSWKALRRGDRLRIHLPGDTDPGALLGPALEAGARVVSVTPRTESLEDLFVREARSKGKSSGAASKEAEEAKETKEVEEVEE
ncbi:MAG: ABC transporter ATP-binding protein [bacterium]